MAKLDLDTDGDGGISVAEFSRALDGENYDKFYTYLENMQKNHPERKVRYSDTVFLRPYVDRELFDKLRYRIVNLTGLPYGVIRAGEDVQVVRYRASGHYHAHLDSERSDKGKYCCQHMDWGTGCRLCRLRARNFYEVTVDEGEARINYHLMEIESEYMTVLYFLNHVEQGGETAFPIADNATLDTKIIFGKDRHRLDLARHCHDSNVYYTPKKRSAIIWYNHKVDPETGWFGEVDFRSLHGGCNVIKGSKWIANNWIDASPHYSSDIDMYVKSLFDKSL